MTGPRNVAVLASTLVLCAAIGCTNFYEIPIETPIQPKMDVTPFTRVLVAGFISGGTDDVDGNLETVRLLRSQLRSKSTLRVIEAEVLPLTDIARDQVKSPAPPSAPAADSGRIAPPVSSEPGSSHGGSAQPAAEPASQTPAQVPAPATAPAEGALQPV